MNATISDPTARAAAEAGVWLPEPAEDGYTTERHGGLYTHEEFDAALESIQDGTSSELWACPVDGSRQGAARTGTTPGTPRDFNAGTWTQLRCGHTIV